ncbi:MAG: hypothetical protein Q4C47_01915 [Planctomycetia bacterium]|nr:hypothetical protein [Planctomycetia bacterium]
MVGKKTAEKEWSLLPQAGVEEKIECAEVAPVGDCTRDQCGESP